MIIDKAENFEICPKKTIYSKSLFIEYRLRTDFVCE